MGFKNFRFNVGVRIAGLVLTSFIFFESIGSNSFALTIIFVLGLLAVQIASLFKYLDKSNNEIVSFLDSIRYDDLSIDYSTDGSNEKVDHLNREFNKVLKRFREVRNEKEADFQYMKNIVFHVGIGLITFNKRGEVQIINTAAKRLLRVSNLDNISELNSLDENLVDMFFRLKTGGRDLIKLEINEEIIQLAVYAIELTLRGEEFKLVSIQNIQSELEEKEMDAWQNLVRVLTHEIMNSVTPISSLSATVEQELKGQLSNDQEVNQISNNDVKDLHLAVQTIQKRSTSLIRFVQDFRNLTHIPKPEFSRISVKEMLNHVLVLLKKEASDKKVRINLRCDPEDMSVNVDKGLIEQVLINLIKNAIQAFDEETNRLVEVSASLSSKSRPVISVKDNGTGIDEEALQKIFIPFFTTKKSGSGIGLSLSRQIMRKHQGSISVRSVIDEGTEFELRF